MSNTRALQFLFISVYLSNRKSKAPRRHKTEIMDHGPTSDQPEPTTTAASSVAVWCKGCRSAQPLASFMYRVDDVCYRMSLQCHRCLHKSSEHYRIHRADIKAARAMRERDAERTMCVCGTSVYTRHREKHLMSKRHQTVVAILRHGNALPASPTSPLTTD